MTRRKIKLEYIENNTNRKSSFKKRKNGILKKVHELSILCGIDACAMIYSPYEAEPFVWPSRLDTRRIISRFRALPETEKTRKMFNQASSIDQRIRKSQVQIQKLQRDNTMKDMEILMHQCMAGFTSLQNVSSLSHLIEMGCLADQKMRDIATRMKELNKNGMVNLQMGRNSSQNLPLVNPSLQAEFGWSHVPRRFHNTCPIRSSFSTLSWHSGAGTSSHPRGNDTNGPSFKN